MAAKLCHTDDVSDLRIAGHGLVNPVNERGNACDNWQMGFA